MFFPLENATVSINGFIDWNQRDALNWNNGDDGNEE